MCHATFFVDSWLLVFQAIWYLKIDIIAIPNDVENVGTEVVTTFAMQSKKVCNLYT